MFTKKEINSRNEIERTVEAMIARDYRRVIIHVVREIIAGKKMYFRV